MRWALQPERLCRRRILCVAAACLGAQACAATGQERRESRRPPERAPRAGPGWCASPGVTYSAEESALVGVAASSAPACPSTGRARAPAQTCEVPCAAGGCSHFDESQLLRASAWGITRDPKNLAIFAGPIGNLHMEWPQCSRKEYRAGMARRLALPQHGRLSETVRRVSAPLEGARSLSVELEQILEVGA